MSENKYFDEALSAMVSASAYKDAVLHMHRRGLSPEEIRKQLDYPVSLEKIQKVISDYEEEQKSPESEYAYVQNTDEYGRRSFLRVKK